MQDDFDPRGTIPTFNYNQWLKTNPCENEWEEDALIRYLMRPMALRLWRRFASVRHLTYADHQGLTFLALNRAVQHFLYARGRPLSSAIAERTAMVSTHIGIELYRLPEPRFRWTRAMVEFEEEWLEHVLHQARQRVAFGGATERDHAVWLEFDWICKVVGLPRDSEQMAQVGRKLAVMAGYVGSREPCPMDLAQEMLRLSRDKLGCWGEMMYVDEQGVVSVGPHQARDAIIAAYGLSRTRRKRGATETERAPTTVLSTSESRAAAASEVAEYAPDDVVDEDAVDAARAVSEREMIERMRAFMARRKQTLRVGTIAYAVADYVVPFSQNELSLAEVAAAVRRPEASAFKELRRLGRELAEAIKVA